MSNWAALIDVLSVAGSRLSDGEPNASGTVWFFEPDTNTPVNVYSDAAASAIVTAPVTLTEGGLVSDADYPDGIFVTQPIRLLIQDVDGETVSDFTYIPATAGNVGLNNDGWTGTTVDEAFTALYTSTGGVDGTYLESAGATERTIQEKFSETLISVKDFGAVGDGIAIDTTAIQAAMSRVLALGGGICYFPPGEYIVDQGFSLTAANGVVLMGAKGSTTITQTNATATTFTFATSSIKCGVAGLIIGHSTSTTGAAISVAAGLNFYISDTDISGGNYAYAADFSGASSWTIADSFLIGTTRGVRSNTSSTTCMLINTQLTGVASSALEINGSGIGYTLVGGFLAGAKGILFNASYTGSFIRVYGTRNVASSGYDLSGLATDPDLRRWGDGVDGYTTSQASGGGVGSSFTPDRSQGDEMHVRLTSGGAAICTINAATPVPATTMRDTHIVFKLTAAAGGAITWTFNAVYVLVGGGTTIAGSDGTTIVIDFMWDVQTSEWREYTRCTTAT